MLCVPEKALRLEPLGVDGRSALHGLVLPEVGRDEGRGVVEEAEQGEELPLVVRIHLQLGPQVGNLEQSEPELLAFHGHLPRAELYRRHARSAGRLRQPLLVPQRVQLGPELRPSVVLLHPDQGVERLLVHPALL